MTMAAAAARIVPAGTAPARGGRRGARARAACAGRGRRRGAEASASSSGGGAPSVVVPGPDYRIAATLVGAAGALAAAHAYGAALPVGALGAFLGVQTSRVRFRFEADALEVVIGDAEEDSGENAFVGGKNRWKYDSFVNWEFFPSPDFPVLVYFKETQTKGDGQIHFFPVLFNATELYDVMAARCGPTQNSSDRSA